MGLSAVNVENELREREKTAIYRVNELKDTNRIVILPAKKFFIFSHKNYRVFVSVLIQGILSTKNDVFVSYRKLSK